MRLTSYRIKVCGMGADLRKGMEAIPKSCTM